MAITYKEALTTGTESVAAIKQAVLTCSDWSHLQLTTGTQATTLASAAAVAAVSISTTATIPSGSYVVIGNGSANPEVRVTTGVSGAGPYTVTFAKALEASYGSGAAVGVGTYVKATTTRGAQMVIDFLEAAITTTQLSLAVYRQHNGTTGVDKTLRYLYYGIAALTNPMRIRVSASKEHLYFEVEGPRSTEAGGDINYGPNRRFGYIGDIVPYHASDTVPAVICIMGDYPGSGSSGQKAAVSRNQADTDSWVFAMTLTLGNPTAIGYPQEGSWPSTWQQMAKADGKVYLWPYVIVEDRDGLRGRPDMYFGGWSQTLNYNPQGYGVVPFVMTEGSFVSYGGTTYRLIKPVAAGPGYVGSLSLTPTQSYRADDVSPLIALPYSRP